MKKLLSLLSVLTIGGTVIPTTIAASPYQKENIKLENSDINYLQTNNLENLNRNKRSDNNKINEIIKIIFKTYGVANCAVVANNSVFLPELE